ncbi:MAG: InlB B-repeat-containing protein, partial [Mucilaginibacter sp.]
ATGIAIPNAIDIDVTANTEGLSPGVYNATITATGEAGGINYTAATLCVTLNVQQNATALQYNLAITSNGNGIVNKSPDLENYNDGTPVTLTASPGPGQLFTGWGGSYSGTVNPLQVIMNDNKTVTASFTSSPCNLAVTTIGNGTVSKSPNQTTYPPGSKVTLTATPAAGQQFTGWSGSVTSATSPLSVTMDVSKTITANFAPLQYALIIATSGSGSVITNPAQAAYNSGSTLTLTAIAATGQQFTGWSGSATGTANPLNITMTAAKSVTANFQSQVLITNLSVGSKKAYSVSQLNTGTTHYTDRTYKITSAPAIIDQAPFIKTPNDDRSSKAASLIQFTLTQRALVYIAYDPRAGKIPAWLNGWQKSTATLGITDAVIDHLNLYSKVYPAGKVALGGNMVSPAVGAQSNYLVIAVAQPIQYDLTVLTNGSGTVTKNPNQNAYNAGTIISLTATPAIGQKFTGWSGAASGTANPVAITMNAAKTVTANFSAAQYGLTLSVNGKGSVVKSPDQPDYAGGSTVVLTATSSAGQQFTGWSGSATGSNNPLTITMDDAKAITANFSTIVYDFMISTNGNGRVTKSPDQSTYASGSSVMLTAIPAEGEQFTGWSGSLDASTNPVTITMDADKSVMANFSATEYALLVNTNGNGSVAKSPDQLTYASGSTVTLKATPAPGQHFDGWSGNVSGTNNPLTIIVNEAENITANFSAIQYSLTVNTNGNGSVNRNPDQVMYTAGSSVALMATPRDGYHFTSWSDDAEGADNPITVTVNANKTVTATFDKVSQGRGGSAKNAIIENASGIYVPEKQESATGLKIYPNPFHGDRLRLEVFNLPKQQKVNIIISDAFGNIYQNIKEVTDKAGALNRQIVFNKLISTGLYILNINTGQGSKFIKIIVN